MTNIKTVITSDSIFRCGSLTTGGQSRDKAERMTCRVVLYLISRNTGETWARLTNTPPPTRSARAILADPATGSVLRLERRGGATIAEGSVRKQIVAAPCRTPLHGLSASNLPARVTGTR